MLLLWSADRFVAGSAATAHHFGMSPLLIGMVVLSTVGRLTDNVAVIIGAMVIAPFLGPSVALALSTCLADYELAKNGLRILVAGIAIAFLLSRPSSFCGRVD